MKPSNDLVELAGMIVGLTYRDMTAFVEAINDGSYSSSKKPDAFLKWAEGVLEEALVHDPAKKHEPFADEMPAPPPAREPWSPTDPDQLT